MRNAQEQPINPTEQYIEDVLVAHGANKENLQFRHEVNASRCLRISYWSKMNAKAKEILESFVKECDMDDDDCGTLYFYHIIPSKN